MTMCASRTDFFFLYILFANTFALVNTTHVHWNVKRSTLGFHCIITITYSDLEYERRDIFPNTLIKNDRIETVAF